MVVAAVPACIGSKASSPPRSAQPAPEAAPKSLQTRFEEYWQARIQNNLQLALQYEHPGQQKRFGEEDLLARLRSGVAIKEVTAVDPQALQPDPNAQEAKIDLSLKYEYRLPFGGDRALISTFVTDSWRKEQGVWYHILKVRRAPRKK